MTTKKKSKIAPAGAFKLVTAEVNGKKVFGYRVVMTVCNQKGKLTIIAAPTLAKLKQNWKELSTRPFDPATTERAIILQDRGKK
jgi:hypothetical protein